MPVRHLPFNHNGLRDFIVCAWSIVYIYVDPRDDSIFYVGKGVGTRCLSHLADRSKSDLARHIAAIKASGVNPRVDILVHGLPDEQAAFRVEAALIDVLGKKLKNRVRGWRTASYGRMTLEQAIAKYDPKEAYIKEPSLLIRINQLYRYGMTPVDLYDATRGVWRIGPTREKAKYAFAIYESTVKEVYRINEWLPAGSSFSTREGTGLYDPDRWEFIGVIADERIRRKYRDRSVEHYFPRNAQTPFIYVNLEGT